MGFITTITTVSIILLFSLDIATDVATGVELVLNDNPYCEFSFCLFVLYTARKHTIFYLLLPILGRKSVKVSVLKKNNDFPLRCFMYRMISEIHSELAEELLV